MVDVVLTADRTLMTEYHGVLDLGHFACFPDRLIPNFLRYLLYPRLPKGICTYALRRVESKLIDEGFDVVVIHPQELYKIKKLKPKIVGVSTVDPLSRKPHSWTLLNILGGGKTVAENEFYKLLTKINEYKKKLDFKIIVGGPGASEFDSSKKYNSLFDHYVIDPGEGAAELFHKSMKNEQLPRRYISHPLTKEEEFSIIKRPVRCSALQITQGCPRKCDFCAFKTVKWLSFSRERILKEIQVNLQRNLREITLISEDIMLYGAKDVRVNHDALVKLMESICKVKKEQQITRIFFSNASIAAIINGKKTIEKISDILNIKEDCPVNPVIGFETGSKRLIKKYMQKKAKPYDPNDWPELVEKSIKILNDNNWYPTCNLITGLPGETEDDVIDTINLVDDVKDYDLIFYIFYFVPIEGTKLENSNFFLIENLGERRWELFYKCWMKSIKAVRRDTDKIITNKLVKIVFLKLLNEVERELNRYKNDPFAMRDKYSKLHLDEIKLLRFLGSRYSPLNYFCKSEQTKFSN